MKRVEFKWLAMMVALTLLSVGPVSAHTSILTTTPVYESTLTEMPTEISIEFTDELMTFGNETINTVEIDGPDNKTVKVSKIEVANNLITASLRQNNYLDGTYRVSYRVVSADGHVVSGSYNIYLNAPTTISNSLDSQDKHHSFFHIHKTHIIWSGIVLMAILLWYVYRRHQYE